MRPTLLLCLAPLGCAAAMDTGSVDKDGYDFAAPVYGLEELGTSADRPLVVSDVNRIDPRAEGGALVDGQLDLDAHEAFWFELGVDEVAAASEQGESFALYHSVDFAAGLPSLQTLWESFWAGEWRGPTIASLLFYRATFEEEWDLVHDDGSRRRALTHAGQYLVLVVASSDAYRAALSYEVHVQLEREPYAAYPRTIDVRLTAWSSGAPLAGIRVALGASAATTDAAGNAVLEDVPPGDYIVKLGPSGYQRGTPGYVTVLNNARRGFVQLEMDDDDSECLQRGGTPALVTVNGASHESCRFLERE